MPSKKKIVEVDDESRPEEELSEGEFSFEEEQNPKSSSERGLGPTEGDSPVVVSDRLWTYLESTHSTLPERIVYMCPLTEEEIIATAVVKVSEPMKKNSDYNKTVYDPRMGPMEPSMTCTQCGCGFLQCRGHLGYIELPRAVLNPTYEDKVLAILQSICFACKKPRIPNEKVKALGITTFAEYKENAKGCVNCYYSECSAKLPQFYKRTKETSRGGLRAAPPTIMMFPPGKRNANEALHPDTIREIFREITDESITTMKLNRYVDILEAIGNPIDANTRGKSGLFVFRPESMVPKIIPVLPICGRLRVAIAGEKRHDDITDIYNNILKLVHKYPTAAESTKESIYRKIRDLHWSLVAKTPKGPSSSVREVKSISDRLSGKTGRKVMNVAGKRSNMTARSVITPGGDSLDFGQVGFPKIFAKRLSFPEKVTEWNIRFWEKELLEGRVNAVERDFGERKPQLRVDFILKKNNGRFIFHSPRGGLHEGLLVGDVVNRHVRDGDIVPTNRQPSLRPESIRGQEVRLHDDKTLKIPLADTRPYGADFDGDEANVHVIQVLMGRIETSVLMRSRTMIVTPQNSAPIMGAVQNSLAISNLATDTFISARYGCENHKNPNGDYELWISREDMFDAYAQARIPSDRIRDFLQRASKFYPKHVKRSAEGKLTVSEEVPGKLVYSVIFPRWYTVKKTTGINTRYPMVIVNQGILDPLSGPLCKKSIGGQAGSFVHAMYRDHPATAAKFLSEIQHITSVLALRIGFSLGLSDCLTTKSAQRDIAEALQTAEQDVKIIVEKNLEPDEMEQKINASYNKVREIAPKLAKEHMNKHEHNSLARLAIYGTKGNPHNVGSVGAVVGQQNLEGRRLKGTVSFGRRLLPHIPWDDQNPESHGFIKSNYLNGLNPKEALAAAMSGREGVIATSTKTADTGYIQKKLAKFMGDLATDYSGAVRNGAGDIISFLYGGDGLAGKGLIFPFSEDNGIITKGSKRLFFSKVDDLVNRLETQRTLDREGQAKEKSEKKKGVKRKITEDEIREILGYFEAGNPGFQSDVTRNATESVRSTLRVYLEQITIHEDLIPELCAYLYRDYLGGKICNGYPVGVEATLSVGEPSTQLTLNTCHHAGNSEKDVTLGVPRLKELMNASEPSLVGSTIYIKDIELETLADPEGPKENKVLALERVRRLASSIVFQRIENFCVSVTSDDRGEKRPKVELLRVSDYNPEEESPLSFKGKYKKYERPQWVNRYIETHPYVEELGGFEESKWVVKLYMDPQKLYDHDLTLIDIAEIITSNELAKDGQTIVAIPSPMMESVIYIYAKFSEIESYTHSILEHLPAVDVPPLLTAENSAYFATREVILRQVLNIKVQGIAGITKTFAKETPDGWIVDSVGSNLTEVMSLSWVDSKRTISDSIWEIYNKFGIEATRAFLATEIERIVCFDGVDVNFRHFEIIVDNMCFSGTVSPVSRYGISRDVGPLSKIMFEKPTTEAAEAAFEGEVDFMRTNDACICLGLPPRLGTGNVVTFHL
jgi:DNA-directed RNA polymerase beta' subunit